MAKSSSPALPETPTVSGYIDFHGYAAAAGGWLFCGWVNHGWDDTLSADAVVAHFERGQLCATILEAWHDRQDIAGKGIGVVVFLGATGRILGDFLGLEVRCAGGPRHIKAAQNIAHLRETDVVARARPLVVAGTGSNRARLLALLSRQIFEGASTLARLPVAVHLAVDESILVPPDGLLLIGWFIDPTQSVRSIRLRSGSAMSESLSLRWIGVERPDIIAALEPKYGALNQRCGFVAYAPACVMDLDRLYLEVELKDGEIGYEVIPRPVRRGLAAIRRVLECIELTSDELEAAFDKVIGSPLVAINRVRLTGERHVSEMAFGPQPENPVCSVVVPLYGRMDFAMFQLALLSEYGFREHEIIYVLDDPPRKRELLDLAHSAYARFGLPFRLVMSDTNLGYAPANNIGLSRARGEFICFLNSDVMPRDGEWLNFMIEDLRQDSALGVVGAMLLFEDGTVQHDGMAFSPLSQFANWPFPMHPGKGRMPSRTAGILRVEAVTGACMVMRRSLAQDLRGFDEDYVTGDFEDTDLCLRVRDKGLWSAVDARAVLYHLERQSQITPDRRWRSYLSLLNAWTHTRRWFRKSGAVRHER